MNIQIDGVNIGDTSPTYFIADIAANHDGSIDRARKLIHLAKEAGADAAKFQHFKASKIVSDYGFEHLKEQKSHQALWKQSVTEVYEAASVPDEWTSILKTECDRVGITFFSSPYDFAAVDSLDSFVPAYKIGSGDIDWLEEIEYIAKKGKPVIIAAGAATMDEVKRAMSLILSVTKDVVLLQCNTNYTGNSDNIDHLHLNVISQFRLLWPDVIVGLSDHTREISVVLGAVALGARVIERHFTDDNERTGPDHHFALNPASWREMVIQTRQLERALGSGEKFVASNEIDSAVVQRRCIRAARDLPAGHVISRKDIDVLRPATAGAIRPNEIDQVIGKSLLNAISFGQEFQWKFLTPGREE
jgi:sialic acid synthase SpsE